MIRNTVQRTVILNTVRQMHNHPTADQVFEAVRQSVPGVSRATVYRVLGHLSEEKLIRRVEIPNAPDRFDFTLREHAHCLCDVCRQVFDYPIRVVLDADDTAFAPRETDVVVRGVCATCRQKI